MQNPLNRLAGISPGVRQMLLLICVSAPSFMLNLDANIIAVSLPSIAQGLKANFAGIEWVITAYTLTFASLMLPAGALADRFGRKHILILGLTTFTLASLLCGAASSLTMLIAARALQGAGAAMQLSAGLAVLSHSFSGAARARAFAFWGSVVGIGISLGPIAGGIITQSFGWQWAFYINLPIGAVMIAMSIFVVSSSKDPDSVRFDFPGVGTFSAFLFLTTLALISGNHDGRGSANIIAELSGGAIFLALFIIVESRQQRPMLDFSFFRKPTYLGANIAQLAFAAGLLTMLTFMPIYFQSGLGFPPRKAGLLMLPMALPLFIVPRIVTASLAHRLTGRAILTLGLSIISVGLIWMALGAGELGEGSVLAAMVVTGIGAGLLNGETTKVGMTVIPPERAGMASGISGTARFTGVVIGFAALGVVFYSRIESVITAGLPALNQSERTAFIREVVSGNLSAHASTSLSAPGLHTLALRSFGEGYEALLLAGAALTAAAAAATWLLVRASDTEPVRKPGRRDASLGPTHRRKTGGGPSASFPAEATSLNKPRN
jgi:EmrB/QacA subfamily drug resistance transporter